VRVGQGLCQGLDGREAEEHIAKLIRPDDQDTVDPAWRGDAAGARAQ
jgi:hypothetical protein